MYQSIELRPLSKINRKLKKERRSSFHCPKSKEQHAVVIRIYNLNDSIGYDFDYIKSRIDQSDGFQTVNLQTELNFFSLML